MPPQFLTINDFRKGINTQTVNNAAQDILDAPPGAASDRSYGCYALTTGALAPLPKLRTDLTQSFTMPAGSFDPAATVKPTGLFAVGPLANFSGGFNQNAVFKDELHLMCEGPIPGPGVHRVRWTIRLLYKPVPTDVQFVAANGSTLFYGIPGLISRVRDANFNQPGLPTLVFSYQDAPPNNLGGVFMWPDPTAPTTNGFFTLASIAAEVVGLSGRILLLMQARYSHGDTLGRYYTNEDITYTDPPNSDVLTSNQPTVLDADNPDGFMSWGSLVYGELILIRRSGGAIVVDGDIYAPQVTILKGVKPIGNLMNVASPSTSGLVYCVENDGAWIWEGGNSSRKISTISDRFYDRSSGNPEFGVAVKHCRWGQFIAFPNGFLWDTDTEAWFRLVSFNADPIDPFEIALVETGKGNPDFLYTAEDSFTGNGPTLVHIFDRNQQTDHYVWWSAPIKLSENMRVDVKEIVVNVTNIPTAGATIDVWLEDATTIITDPPTGAANAHFFVDAATRDIGVQRLRVPTGITNMMSCRVVMKVASTNAADPAPTILSLAMAYEESHPLPQDTST